MSHERVHVKWNAPAGAVYIGRPGFWGNPIELDDPKDDKQRRECVRRFIVWIGGSDEGQLRMQRVHELKGKHLKCFCAPRLCHGDVLAKLADGVGLEQIERELLP